MFRSLVVVLLLAACGHATVVTKSPGAGVIELRGEGGRAREEADQLMAAQCGVDNFTIASETDEPSGGRRIHFVCGNVLPVDRASIDAGV